MPRKCTVCTHKKRKEIDKAVTAGVDSYRSIAMQFSVTPSALLRHIETHLKLTLGVIYEKKKEETGIDVWNEFEQNLAFARDLREACRVYLADPTDPLKLIITPNADEIQVAYYDHTDTTEQGTPTKKTAPLSNLLNAVQEIGKMLMAADANTDGALFTQQVFGRILAIDKITIKHVDLRSFAAETIKTCDMCIDKFARLSGLYQKEQENKKNLENTIAAIKDYRTRFPQIPEEEVFRTFAAGRQLPVEKIKSELGLIG